MDISKLLERDNAQYWGSLIKNSANGVLIMIFLFAVIIAVIIDTFLLNTFPAHTLITIFICLCILAVKIYIKKCENTAVKKEYMRQFQNEYEYILPILDNLTEEEIDLLRPLVQKNIVSITFEQKIKIQHLMAKGLYRYISILNYPGIPEPVNALKTTPIFRLILQKYILEK